MVGFVPAGRRAAVREQPLHLCVRRPWVLTGHPQRLPWPLGGLHLHGQESGRRQLLQGWTHRSYRFSARHYTLGRQANSDQTTDGCLSIPVCRAQGGGGAPGGRRHHPEEDEAADRLLRHSQGNRQVSKGCVCACVCVFTPGAISVRLKTTSKNS